MNYSELTIMIVEDHGLAMKMAIMAIAPLSCEIHTATTGTEAILNFEENAYDFIFMDLGLPDINGCEVTKKIRQIESRLQTHTPIVALTAHSENKALSNKALQCGMDNFITKPLTLTTAKSIIEKHIHKPSTC